MLYTSSASRQPTSTAYNSLLCAGMIWHAWLCYWDPLKTSTSLYLAFFLFGFLHSDWSITILVLDFASHCSLFSFLLPLIFTWPPLLGLSLKLFRFWCMSFGELFSTLSFLFFLFLYAPFGYSWSTTIGYRTPSSISLQWGFCELADFYTHVYLSSRIVFVVALLRRWSRFVASWKLIRHELFSQSSLGPASHRPGTVAGAATTPSGSSCSRTNSKFAVCLLWRFTRWLVSLRSLFSRWTVGRFESRKGADETKSLRAREIPGLPSLLLVASIREFTSQ